jgi:sugar lactone lactonase YvrE
MLKRFTGFMGRFGFLTIGCVFAALAMTSEAVAGVPAVVASSNAKYATGMTDPSKVVLDSLGDIFIADINGTVYVVAPGSTTPKVLMTGLGYGSEGVAVDSLNDVVITTPYYGVVYFIPASGVASLLAGGSLGTTVNLTYAYGFGALDNNYGNFLDAAFDTNGEVYIGVTDYPSGATAYEILRVKTQGASTSLTGIESTPGTAQQVVKGLPHPANSLATDNFGHLFYADGYNVYEINTTTNVSTTIGSGFSKPTGVSVDAAGNLYVSDNNKDVLFEIPNENGTLNPAHQFAVAEPPGVYLGVGFDRQGNFYSGDGYQSGSLWKTTLGALNFGSVAVGSTSSTGSVTFTYNSAVIPASLSLGGSAEFLTGYYTTCSTTTAPTSFPANCFYQLKFTPGSTGVRKGSLQFLSAAGKPLATAYLSGVGTGPALTIDPGTQSSQTALTAWKTPSAVALDAQSNFYVTDSTANVVQVISSAGVAKATLTGFSNPQGIVVDQAGNVIVSDTGHNQIVAIPNENGTLNQADQVVLLPSNANQEASIASFTIASNVVTFTATNSFTVGETVVVSGLSTAAGAVLNGQYLTVATANATSFTANFASANVAATTDSGVAFPATPGVSAPQGLAVGANGAIYVADTGNARVLRVITDAGFGEVSVETVSGGFITPAGVAIDNSNNVFITDSTANKIYEYSQVNGTLITQVNGGSLSAPTAISIDASGSAYVVNSGSSQVLRIPSVNGSLNPNTQITLGSLSLLKTPSGVAVNGSGNVAISDSGIPGLFTLVRTTGALQFGSVDTSQSSIAQTLTLTNAGTSSLTLGNTAYTTAGATTSYAITPATLAPCSGSIILAVGVNCGYSIVFSPTATGPLTDVMSFSSNAVNAATLTANLTGTGTNLPLSTTTLSVLPASPSYGVAVNVLATVTAGPTSTKPPTGPVTFYVDGIPQSPSALTLQTNGLYQATLTFKALSLTASTHIIGANYGGDANNSSSHAAPFTLVIAQSASTTTAAVAPTVDQPAGTPFAYTVNVLPANLGTPTGTVSLYATGTTTNPVAGPYNLTPNKTGTGGTAIFSVPSPTPVGGIGTYCYQVIYSGDVNFLGSTSSTVCITVHPPDYTTVPPATSYTVALGSSVQVPITITGLSGYNGNVTVGAVNQTTLAQTPACTGLPLYVTCSFSPGIVSLDPSPFPYPSAGNPSGVMTLTLATSVPPPTSVSGGSMLWPGALAGLLALALSFKMRRSVLRTRLMSVLLLVFLGSLTLGVSGCGSGSATSADHYVTPKGTSTITVTFSGSPFTGAPAGNPNIVHTLNITLTVQ